MRHIPGHDANAFVTEFQNYTESLLPAMQNISQETDIHTESLAVVPSLQKHDDPIFENKLLAITGNNQAEIDMSGLPKGMYIVAINNGRKQITTKLMR